LWKPAKVSQAGGRRFGRGKHPANLNIGDCCAYALARVSGEPMLFKGDDFPKTDVARVGY
jgi:ribonuclease VapC